MTKKEFDTQAALGTLPVGVMKRPVRYEFTAVFEGNDYKVSVTDDTKPECCDLDWEDIIQQLRRQYFQTDKGI